MANFTKRGAEDFLSAWDGAGLPKELVTPVRDVIARSNALDAEVGVALNSVPGYQRDVIERLATGQVSFVDAIMEWNDLADVLRKPNTSMLSSASILAADTQREILRVAKRYLEERAPELAQVAADGGAPYLRVQLEELDVIRPEPEKPVPAKRVMSPAEQA